jgi:thiamine pyrophosphokinase
MMEGTIVHTEGGATLAGGATFGADDLRDSLALAPRLVAADGGADRLLALGAQPEAVIGDMDSLSDAARDRLAGRLHRVAEQETTDFDKALTRIQARFVIGLGFTGGRIDHELAAFHSLVLRADRPCLLLGRETLALHCPPRLALDLAPGTLVSLFPLGEVEVASRGLRWPTEGLRFSPLGRVGTSNEAAGGQMRLVPNRPGMLLILPRAALAGTVQALAAAPRWPASRGG